MKTILALGIFLMSAGLCVPSNAQVRVNMDVNIGNQPDWGPTGYDHVDFYYFPDIDVYYDVPRHEFVYFEGGAWVNATRLPPRFGHPDFYSLYKVVVNKPRPYRHADFYRRTYGHRAGGNNTGQEVLRDSHEDKYKNHYHDEYDRGRGDDHKNDRGHDNH